MNINDNNVVLNEELIAANTEFLKAVAGAKTEEEVKKVCNDYNVELTEEMWKDIADASSDATTTLGELDESELENVAGGKFNAESALKCALGIAGLGGAIAAGSAVGVVAAAVWIGYNGVKAFRQ